MAPSVEGFERKMDRPVKRGDVLIRDDRLYLGDPPADTYYEITNTSVSGAKLLQSFLGKIKRGKSTIQCVEVRKLTPHGPATSLKLFPRSENLWSDIVQKENRTDNLSTIDSKKD